ncbi:2'-5' RNA ligase family protein [uncultured Microbacterium sp.]|uniref:2'-5' RNA ligase family protein n=1 Tax=uncultured Microbacterium sp. TaxID=191216 RepID=UPI0025CC960D|nr:2'-5' RNA ligase family protein [uncultured Microbacterium sp.]
MTDVVSLELLLDDQADAAVRAVWQALARAGLPSQAQHKGESNRPHVTMLVRAGLGPIGGEHLAPLFPLPVTLGAPLLFGSGRTRVIARSVVPTAALLSLHARVHETAGPGGDADHTRPGAWTPHVTLARRVPIDRVGEALAVWSEAGAQDLTAHAVGLRRWDAASRTVTDLVGHGTLETC